MEKRIGVFIILMIFLSSSSLAVGEYESYQADSRNRGFVRDITSDWSGGVNTTITVSQGAHRQALIVDMDGDGVNEILQYAAGFLIIYDSTLSVQGQIGLGTIDTHPTTTNKSGTVVWTAIVDDVFEVWSWDGSTFTDEFADNSTVKACTTWQGMTCNTDNCFALCEDGASHTTLFTFDVNAGTSMESSRIGKASTVGIVSYWSFNDGTADDEILTNDGTVSGATHEPVGGPNADGAFLFDGSNDVITFGNDASMEDVFITTGTIEFWMNGTDSGVGDWVIGKHDAGFNTGWLVTVGDQSGATTNLTFNHVFSGANGVWTIPAVDLGNWTHIIIGYDASSTSTEPTFYVNGVKQGHTEVVSPTGAAVSDAGDTLTMGGPVVFYNGSLDEVKLHSINLSEAQAEAAFNNGTAVGEDMTMALSNSSNPALSDIDFAAGDDIIFICDYDLDDNFGVCVVDVSTGSFNTGWSGSFVTTAPGVIDDLEEKTDALYISNPVVTSVSGGGGETIFFSYTDRGPCSGVPGTQDIPHIVAIKSNGDTLWTVDGTNTCGTAAVCCFENAGSEIPQPIIAFSADTAKVCFARKGKASSPSGFQHVMVCLNAATGSEINVVRFPDQFMNINTKTGVAFKTQETSREEDFLQFGKYGFAPTVGGSFVFNTNITNIDTTSHISVGDVDGDGNVEIIYSRENPETGIASTDFTNGIPTLSPSLSHSGYFGYANPVCKGSTVTFQARDEAGFSDANYFNDIETDRERISTDCGIVIGNTTIGALSGTNPSVSCFYNSTGTFSVTIFLTDEANPDDLSQFNVDAIAINVIDGIPGSTCDIGSSFVNVPSQQDAPTESPSQEASDDAIDAGFDILLGAGERGRLLAGFLILIALVGGMVKLGAGTSSIIFIGLATAVVNSLLGLWPGYVVILMFVAGFLTFAIRGAVASRTGGE